MTFTNFTEEFNKVARKHGLGPVATSSSVCHNAREVLAELFPKGRGVVASFKDGILTVEFASSSALNKFNFIQDSFEKTLKSILEEKGIATPLEVVSKIS